MSRRSWVVPATAVAILLLLCAAVLGSQGSTAAKWFARPGGDGASGTSDGFTISAADASTQRANNDPAGRVWNDTDFALVNDSRTLSRRVLIQSSTVSSRYAYPDKTLDPVFRAKITYNLAAQGKDCTDWTRTELWPIKGADSAAASGGKYTAPAGTAVTLAPGETRHVCVDFALALGSDNGAQRAEILKQLAGGGIKVQTAYKTEQQYSTTTGAESGTVPAYYRIGLPQPVPNAAKADASAVPGCVRDGSRSRLYWNWLGEWESSVSASTVSAVDHWELWTSANGQSFSKLTSNLYSYEGKLNGTNIPTGARSIGVDRAQMSGGTTASPVKRAFLVVGVLAGTNGGSPVRFAASKTWTLSWNGVNNGNLCAGTATVPDAVTGQPNMPGPTW